MYISNSTKDYDNITDYGNVRLINGTNSGKNNEIIIPLFTIIPCGMSLICLTSLIVNTLIKPLFKKNKLS